MKLFDILTFWRKHTLTRFNVRYPRESKGKRKPHKLRAAVKSARIATKEQGGQTNGSAEEKSGGRMSA